MVPAIKTTLAFSPGETEDLKSALDQARGDLQVRKVRMSYMYSECILTQEYDIFFLNFDHAQTRLVILKKNLLLVSKETALVCIYSALIFVIYM